MTLVKDSKAYEGRWSEYVMDGFQNAEVLYEEGEADYQGSASILAVVREPIEYGPGETYVYGSWSWGSCSGCDGWEDLPDEQVRAEAALCRVQFHGKEMLRAWRDMLSNTNRPHWQGGTIHGNLIAAINKELGE